ncbi:serine hydrolase domain-containing protein [Phaeacidiphilus oryzae]|uniref:serine hydrolase domain-containing protein n=1 Tax=Phaeacidiphilus oryzae TaxID=348818 RepID=UPI00055DD39F|nr:serine hydrolase domain-containing protein [Phaeacidiphilus oryzae]
MSGGGLSKTALDRMRGVLAGFVERGELPGLVAAVERRGETVVEAFGELRRDSVFRISSMSKPVIAAAALTLVEDGTVRLEEPVDRLLPELAARRVLRSPDAELDDTVPAERPILVRDLLTFTAGYGLVLAAPGSLPIQRAMDERELGQGPPAPAVPPEPDEWLRRLGELPLLHQPGAEWRYNTGADILGVLISRACGGRPLEEVLRERLFGPLGMRETAFSVPPAQAHRLPPQTGTDFATGAATAYDPGGAESQWARPPAFPSGAAGLVSTVDDYLAFARMLLGQGRLPGWGRLLARPTVAAMTSDQLTERQKRATVPFDPEFFEGQSWGLGLSVTTRRTGPATTPGSFGWAGGLGTAWATDPAEQMNVLIFTQRAWASATPPAVFQTFWNLTYAAIDD